MPDLGERARSERGAGSLDGGSFAWGTFAAHSLVIGGLIAVSLPISLRWIGRQAGIATTPGFATAYVAHVFG
jgi:hypothetical protein